MSNVHYLSPTQFVQLPYPPRLVDVRTALEYRTCHVPGAINLSLQRLLLGQIPGLAGWVLPDWFRTLSKDDPLAVICLTAHRSPIAAQALAKAGFSKVSNITGGILAWEKAGLPVQRVVAKRANP